MASLVPEPMEKCAVCAASPISTTLPWCQRAQRTVVKFTHRELLPMISCPPSASPDPAAPRSAGPGPAAPRSASPDPAAPPKTPAHRPRIISMDASSLRPGGSPAAAAAGPANPARRHTSSCASRMNVLASRL